MTQLYHHPNSPSLLYQVGLDLKKLPLHRRGCTVRVGTLRDYSECVQQEGADVLLLLEAREPAWNPTELKEISRPDRVLFLYAPGQEEQLRLAVQAGIPYNLCIHPETFRAALLEELISLIVKPPPCGSNLPDLDPGFPFRFLDGLSLGVLVADGRSHRFVYANEAMASAMGYGVGELKTLGVEDIHPADSLPQVIEFFKEISEDIRSKVDVLPMVRKNGEIWMAELHSARLIIEGREYQLGVFHDVTDYANAQADLYRQKRHAEEQEFILRQAQAIAKVGYWEYDQSLNRLTWSDQVYAIFELDNREEPATYEGFLAYVHPDDRSAVVEAYEQHQESGEPYAISHRVCTSKGNLKYVLERCESTQDPESGEWHSLGVVADITDLKKAETELSFALHQMEALLENQPDRILVYDSDKRIVDYYPKNSENYLIPIDHFLERPFDAVPLPENLKVVAKEALEKVSQTSEPIRVEYDIGTDDNQRWYEARFIPLKDEQVLVVIHENTEFKTMHRDLRVSNDLFEQAGHMAGVGAWKANMESGSLFWSATTRQIHEVGEDFDPKIGTLDQFYPRGESYELLMQAFHQAMAGRETFDLEVKMITAQENVRWLRWMGKAILNDPDCPSLYGTLQDITDQRLADEEQQLQTKLLELLMRVASTYINLPVEGFDEEINHSLEELGRFVGADRFFIFEYDFDALTSSNTHEWCAEGIEPMIEVLQDVPVSELDIWLKQHRQGKVMRVADVQALGAEDPLRHILEPQGIKSLNTMPMMRENECIGFIGLDYVRNHHHFTEWEDKLLTIFAQMLVNVQVRVSLLNELTESRNLLEGIIESSGSMIYIKDLRGRYLRVNRCWSDITGISADSVIGKTDTDLWDSATARQLMEQDQAMIQCPDVKQFEESFEYPSGMRHYITVMFPVRDSLGDLYAIAGMRTEITEMKKVEKERIALVTAEASIREKNIFLAKMSHEIRTPLNAIIGFSALLGKDQSLQAGDQKKVRTIRRSGEHLLSMIEDMLEYAKLEDKRMTCVETPMNLYELLSDFVSMFQLRAQEKGVKFSFYFEETLETSLIGDVTKFRQVILNLLSNAVKFTDVGVVTFHVYKESESEVDQWVRFEIKDSGPGIPEEEVPRLFEEFYQGSVGKRKGGTGLGLPIANSLARIMGATGIRLGENNANGARFIVSLPFRKQSAKPESRTQRVKSEKTADHLASTPGLEAAKLRGLLTPSEREVLQLHISRGEMPAFRNLVHEITDLDEESRKHLLQLASVYDYTSLTALLSDSDGKPELNP